ncbi:hypothetical protein Tco_0152386 [Tanacetum coccineum]
MQNDNIIDIDLYQAIVLVFDTGMNRGRIHEPFEQVMDIKNEEQNISSTRRGACFHPLKSFLKLVIRSRMTMLYEQQTLEKFSIALVLQLEVKDSSQKSNPLLDD